MKNTHKKSFLEKKKKKKLTAVSLWGVYFIGQEKLLPFSLFLPKVLVLGNMWKVFKSSPTLEPEFSAK